MMNTAVNTINTMDAHELWEYVLSQIELSVSPTNFNTWFKSSSIVKIEEGIVYIGVPSQFFREWYLKKFNTTILKIIRSVSFEFRNVEYLIVKDERKKYTHEQRNDKPTIELPLNEFYVNKNDNLNPRYTFDSFVVGSFNELAYTAAKAAINRPGITYNPLFIYGDTGRGKTHLIQAVGNSFKKLYPNRKVFYLTSEKFAVDYTDSLQSGTANRFKDKYRGEKIATLDEVVVLFKTYPDVTLFVELKRISIDKFGSDVVFDVVGSCLEKIINQCVFISFSFDMLELIQQKTVLPIGAVLDEWNSAITTEHERLARLNPEYFFCDINSLPKEGKLKFLNSKIITYECVDPGKAISVLQRGVSLIETFDIKNMLQGIAKACL